MEAPVPAPASTGGWFYPLLGIVIVVFILLYWYYRSPRSASTGRSSTAYPVGSTNRPLTQQWSSANIPLPIDMISSYISFLGASLVEGEKRQAWEAITIQPFMVYHGKTSGTAHSYITEEILPALTQFHTLLANVPQGQSLRQFIQGLLPEVRQAVSSKG